MQENTDQNNSEYGDFLRSGNDKSKTTKPNNLGISWLDERSFSSFRLKKKYSVTNKIRDVNYLEIHAEQRGSYILTPEALKQARSYFFLLLGLLCIFEKEQLEPYTCVIF